jgi:hypothetical protein
MAGSGIPRGQVDKSEFWRQVVDQLAGSRLFVRAWSQRYGLAATGFYG